MLFGLDEQKIDEKSHINPDLYTERTKRPKALCCLISRILELTLSSMGYYRRILYKNLNIFQKFLQK